MQRRQGLWLLLGAACLPGPGWALEAPTPPEVLATWPQARSTGYGRLRFMGLRVYDARLWRAESEGAALDDWGTQPLALEIRYLRALEGKQIAERSLDEMRRQGDINPDTAQGWLAQMVKLFPNVKNGDRLTGLNLPGEGARFYLNGQRRGEVRDTEFARRFFGIWLAPQSSDSKLRAALLGQGKP
jgi:hypothetical protein